MTGYYCAWCLKAIVTDGTPPYPPACSEECLKHLKGETPR